MKRSALAMVLGVSALLGGCATYDSYDSGYGSGYGSGYAYSSRPSGYEARAYGYGGPVYTRPSYAPAGPLACGLSGDCSRGFYDARGDWHDGAPWR